MAEGRLKQVEAAERLGLTARQVRRLRERYAATGAAGLASQRKCCIAHSFVATGSHWAGGRLLPERNDPGQASIHIAARSAS